MTKLNISISDKLYKELLNIALEQKVTVDKLVEIALVSFFEKLDKEKYTKSFQRAAKDKEIMDIAEEGMSDYLELLNDSDSLEGL